MLRDAVLPSWFTAVLLIIPSIFPEYFSRYLFELIFLIIMVATPSPLPKPSADSSKVLQTPSLLSIFALENTENKLGVVISCEPDTIAVSHLPREI
ncbi:hypothetical protein HWI79_130 [Cryptosporidium felis]|nr:hypothetical protein HWI79_130 [Cryptosporidium felis]